MVKYNEQFQDNYYDQLYKQVPPKIVDTPVKLVDTDTDFTPSLVPTTFPGYKTPDVTLAKDSGFTETSNFNKQIKSSEFLALLAITMLGAIVLIANGFGNLQVVNFEVDNGYGLPIGWFLVISVILAVLTAHMCYKPYLLNRLQGRYTVTYAIIFYVVAQMFWSTSLFHSRINRGTAGIAIILYLVATLWLGWVCYQYNKASFYIFALLLAWVLYLQFYTFNVDAHPWIPVPLIN